MEFLKKSVSDKKLISDYVEYFELIFSNIIVPVVEVIGPPVPKNMIKHSYDFQINEFIQFIKKENINNQFYFFIMHLDGGLRNALVHKNYYFNKEELYYYSYNPKNNKFNPTSISREKFIEKLVSISSIKLIINVVFGLRLTGLSSSELKNYIEKIKSNHI